MAGKQTTAGLVLRILSTFAHELDKDMPLSQLLAFARVAASGDAGVDQGKLMDDLSMSSAGASRTIQALSSVHYLKDRAGFDVVERVLDRQDNRRRFLKLTPKGDKLITKISAILP